MLNRVHQFVLARVFLRESNLWMLISSVLFFLLVNSYFALILAIPFSILPRWVGMLGLIISVLSANFLGYSITRVFAPPEHPLEVDNRPISRSTKIVGAVLVVGIVIVNVLLHILGVPLSDLLPIGGVLAVLVYGGALLMGYDAGRVQNSIQLMENYIIGEVPEVSPLAEAFQGEPSRLFVVFTALSAIIGVFSGLSFGWGAGISIGLGFFAWLYAAREMYLTN